MTTITTRAGKGSPLSNVECDSNFTNLNTAKLELGQAQSSGTANGVLYLNGSKQVASGSGLTFDGTSFSTTGTINAGTAAKAYRVANWTLAGYSGNTLQFGNATTSGEWTDMSWSLNGSEQMRLTSTGLGLGTSSPGAKLDVNGTANFSGNVTLSGGTANGVLYLNGSKVATSGSALTFDGTTLTNTGNTRVTSLKATGRVYSTSDSSYDDLGVSKAIFLAYDAVSDIGYLTARNYLAATNVPLSLAGSDIRFGTGESGTEQMRLTSTGLGIGTSSPNYSLTAYKAGATATYLQVANGATGAGAANGLLLGVDTSGNGIINAQGSVNLNINVAGLQRATIDQSGNLGLGVTPSAWANSKAFDIGAYGALSTDTLNDANTSLSWNAYATAYNAWKYKNTGSAASRYAQEAGKHYWYTAPSGTAGNAISFTQAMTLDASGNLLVGGTSQLYGAAGRGLIQVSGSTDALLGFGTTSNTGLGYLFATTSGLELASLGSTYVRFSTNGTERARIDASGNLGLGVTPSGWGSAGNARAIQMPATAIYSFSDSRGEMLTNAFNNGTNYVYRVNYPAVAYSQEANTGAHKWFTAPSGTAGNAISFTQAMTLDASGNLLVGTTYSDKKLTVFSGTNNSDVARFTGGQITKGLVISTYASNGNDGGVKFASSDSFAFSTAANERMRLDSSGNLGIGTSSPPLKLSVLSNNNTNNNSVPLVLLGSDRVDRYASIDCVRESASSYIGLAFSTSTNAAPTEKMRIDASGNLGIGTSSPDQKLTLEGGAGFNRVMSDLLPASDAKGLIYVRNNGNASGTQEELRYLARNHGWFSHSGTRWMSLDSIGNLGLGVTPSAWSSVVKALQIGNSSFVGTSTQMLLSQNYVFNGTDTYIANGPASQYYQVSGTHQWRIAPSGTAGNAISFTQAMTLDAGGSLLIGATSAAGSETLRVYNSGNSRINIDQASNGLILGADASGPFLDTSGSNRLAFFIAGTERMRIDSSGNVGIGTSSPGARLRVIGAASTTAARLEGASGANITVDYAGVGDNYFDAGNNIFRSAAGTERARIDSSGNLLVGTTSNTENARLFVRYPYPASGGAAPIGTEVDSTLSLRAIAFRNPNGLVGTIATSGSGTAYNTSSDYRLKENIQPMQNALAVVQQLNPVTYTWKADGSDGQGFIAHELQAVVPDCVTGEKDATRIEKVEVTPAVAATFDEDGNELTPAVEAVFEEREVPVYQGIDTSFLVATLTAAIQEQQTIITSLESRILALEAK